MNTTANPKNRKYDDVCIPSENKLLGIYLPLGRQVPVQRAVRYRHDTSSLPKPTLKPSRFASSEPITVSLLSASLLDSPTSSPELPMKSLIGNSSTKKRTRRVLSDDETDEKDSLTEDHRAKKRTKRVLSDETNEKNPDLETIPSPKKDEKKKTYGRQVCDYPFCDKEFDKTGHRHKCCEPSHREGLKKLKQDHRELEKAVEFLEKKYAKGVISHRKLENLRNALKDLEQNTAVSENQIPVTSSSSESSTVPFDPAKYAGDVETLASRRERRDTSSTKLKIHEAIVKRTCEKCGKDVEEKEKMFKRYCKICCGECKVCHSIIFPANDHSVSLLCEGCAKNVQISNYSQKTVEETKSVVSDPTVSLTLTLSPLESQSTPSPRPPSLIPESGVSSLSPQLESASRSTPSPNTFPRMASEQQTNLVTVTATANSVHENSSSTSLMSALPLLQKMKLVEAMMKQHKGDPELNACISLLFQ